MNKDYSYQVTK